MTVTSGLHAQAERTKKQKRKEEAPSGGGSAQGPESGGVAQSRGRPAKVPAVPMPTMMMRGKGGFYWKIPRGDIDGVGEVK